ncbi:MAG: DUF3352 domain-containing protein, partial [Pseudanabaenaceae cyanobacterium]
SLGAGAYWWLTIRRPLSGLVGAAQAVPQEATVVLALRTSASLWQPLAQFGTPESRQLLAKAIAAGPAQTLWQRGSLDFQQDIQPWIGEGALAALVPLQPDTPPATLAIAPVQNRERAEVFLAKYRNALTQQGAQFTEKTYGRQVYYESPTRRPHQSVVTALIDGRLAVLTTDAALLHRVIETYRRRSPALATKPAFVEALGRVQELPPRESLAWLYVDGTVGLDFLGPAQALGDSFLAKPQLVALTLTAGFQKEGLRFRLDRTVNGTGAAIEVPRRPLLDRLPSDTLLLISGTNLRQSWATLQTRAQANPISETTLTQWREALAKAQIDLDKEVLGWLTEDFAIAAVPTTAGALRGSGFGLVLLARTTVADLPRQFLSKLERWARSSPGGPIPDNLEIQPETLAQTEVSSWTVRSQSMTTRLAAQGFLTQDVVFWAAGDLVTNLLPVPGTPLDQSKTFRRLTAGLPETNGGYFYWHVGASLPILDRLLPSELKSTPLYTQGRILLDAVRGLAATTTNLSDRIVRLDLLLSLKPTPVD